MITEQKVQVLGGEPDGTWDRLAEAARHGPTAIDAESGAVVVLRYREIEALAHDRRMLGVGLTWFDMMGIQGELRRWYSSLMFTTEGEEHTRLRRLVSRAFTPRSVELLRDDARALVGSAFSELEASGGGDLVASFGRVAVRLMCRLLGVPEGDIGTFGDWLDALSPVFAYMDEEQIRAAETALTGLLGYVGDLVERRRSRPAPDLITALLEAEDDGDRLADEEVATMVSNLLVGGHDTTSSQIGCTFLTLLRHPSAVDALRAGTATYADAVTEVMRFEPSIGLIPRTASEPIEIGGVARGPGTAVMLSLRTGNRDPEVWEDPDELRLDRFASADAPRPLSFGSGVHYCLGANLARMTLEETIRGYAGRRVVPETDLDGIEWRMVLGQSPASLPVSIGGVP